MLKLAAFADEIGPEIDFQIEHLKKNGVTHFELRGVAGKNVLDFDAAMQKEIKAKLDDNGLGVAAIGSPIGKVKLSDSFDEHLERFKVAVELAEFFGAPMIRVFSYFPMAGTTRNHLVRHGRDEVLRRMEQKVAYLDGHDVIMVHENEADIYGETGKHCLDLLQSIDSPKLRAAFDSANFIQCGEDALPQWERLKPYVTHIHIKDALAPTGKNVPAGQGDGDYPTILKDAYHGLGYRGFLTLEPHLQVAGRFSGQTGPDLFAVAVQALRTICQEQKIPLAS